MKNGCVNSSVLMRSTWATLAILIWLIKEMCVIKSVFIIVRLGGTCLWSVAERRLLEEAVTENMCCLHFWASYYIIGTTVEASEVAFYTFVFGKFTFGTELSQLPYFTPALNNWHEDYICQSLEIWF